MSAPAGRIPRWVDVGLIPIINIALAFLVSGIILWFIDVDPLLATQRAAAEQIGEKTTEVKLGIEALAKITGAGEIHLVLGQGHAADGLVAMADESDWPVHRVDTGCYPFAADPFVDDALGRLLKQGCEFLFQPGVYLARLFDVGDLGLSHLGVERWPAHIDIGSDNCVPVEQQIARSLNAAIVTHHVRA